MRPVMLRIEGFTCFKRAQLIDFDGLDLFAISGQTGAGKSSVLDAMVYALYGRIPRIGKRGYTEFISLGASRMSVRFDFTTGERRYRVTRTARRVGPPSAQLEQLTSDGETLRPLADGISNVDKAVAEIVGLDYEGFIQAVVLPQGEFAKFLKSPSGDRTKLLRELLRLMRYEEMRQIAQSKSKAAAGEAEHIEKRLAEDYGGATPTEVGQRENAIAESERKLADLRRKLETSEAELIDARRLREKTAELERKNDEKRGLSGNLSAVSGKREQLEAAGRASKVAPLLNKVQDEKDRVDRTRQELNRAEETLRVAVNAEKKAFANREKALEAAKRIPGLDKSIQQLGEVIGLLEPKRRVEQNIRQLEDEERRTGERLNSLTKQRRGAELTVASARKAALVAESDLERIGYDSKLHQKIGGVLEDATAVAGLSEAAETARAAAVEAKHEAADAKKEADSALKRLEASTRAVEKAVRAGEQAATRLSDAERTHSADHLRSQLRAGQECPVCEQRVSSVPKARKVSLQLDELRAAAEEARQTAAGIQEKHAELQSESRSQAKAETSASKKSEKAVELSTKTAAARDAGRKRLESWAQRIELKFSGRIEEGILSFDRELRSKRSKYDEAQAAVQAARGTMDEAQRSLEKFDSQINGTRDKLAGIAEQLSKANEELKDYKKRIVSVCGEDDPRQARDALQTERTMLDESKDEARRAADAASKNVAVCETQVAAAKNQGDNATAGLQAAREKARQGVRAAGFTSEDAAHAALLDEETTLRLGREVQEFAQKLSAIDARIGELQSELDGESLSQETLDNKEAQRNELAENVETTASDLEVAKAELLQLRERLVKARELASQLAGYQQTARVYGILADELQSNRFQQYLLDEIVEELVAGASERLKKLSDRYALVLREGEFCVVDHDNAGEQRSADTLSGGETFLTSLALALELSTRVQNAAGAVRLESIFIDEGFGTLDPDTLDTVAGAIESLPVGGRMVGIITHIAELTERMPGRIAIDKTEEGARIRTVKQ